MLISTLAQHHSIFALHCCVRTIQIPLPKKNKAHQTVTAWMPAWVCDGALQEFVLKTHLLVLMLTQIDTSNRACNVSVAHWRGSILALQMNLMQSHLH